MEEEDTEGHRIIFQMRNTGNEHIRELSGKGTSEIRMRRALILPPVLCAAVHASIWKEYFNDSGEH